GHDGPAVAPARLRHGYPFDERDSVDRGPIPHDGKADRLLAYPTDETGVVWVSQEGDVLRLLGAADELLISGRTLGHHDEGKIVRGRADEGHLPGIGHCTIVGGI